MAATLAEPTQKLVDVQGSADDRNIYINRVGIKDLRYPIRLEVGDSIQSTVATLDMVVGLDASQKGTHMSRFVEVLEDNELPFSLGSFKDLLVKTQSRLEATVARIDMSFPFFITKAAPVSKVKSLMDYHGRLIGEVNGNDIDVVVKLEIPVTTLCPCSKAISDYGAHNQRSLVTLNVRYTDELDIMDLIHLVEEQASCEIYPLLKRDDEKYVTEKAYDNPVFVEDVVRNITAKLLERRNIVWFTVESENFESIHNHSAYAMVEQDRRAG